MRTCPSCRFLVGDTDATCQFCGADLASGEPPPGAPPGRGAGPGIGLPPPSGSGGRRSKPARSGLGAGGIVAIVIGAILGAVVVRVGAVVFLGTPQQQSKFSAIDSDELAAAVTTTTTLWAPWTAPDGSFTVDLPGTPEVTSIPIELPTGSVTQQMAMVDQGARASSVLWFDVPPPFNFEGAAQGSAREAGAELTSTLPTTLAGLEALRYTMQMPNGGTVVGIVAHDGVGRGYLLLAADMGNPDIAMDRMAASFTRP